MKSIFANIVVAVVLASPLTVKADFGALLVAEWMLETIVGGYLYDVVSGKPDVNEMNKRLETAEKALSEAAREIKSTDAKASANYQALATKLGDLRKEVSASTSRERIQGIVTDVLKQLENRVESIEIRVKEIESLFGFLPTVTPAPLLEDRLAEGTPAVHPLMAEYARLLGRV